MRRLGEAAQYPYELRFIANSFAILLDATRKIFHRRQFAIGDGYGRTVTASVEFQSVPCGKIPHAKDVNFHMDVCIEPRPNPE